jgi:DNA modification methylase
MNPQTATSNLLLGDCRDLLKKIEPGSVQTCVTSPPYFGLRDYGHGDQIGLEETPEKFVANLVEVFRGVKRVLADDGTLWLNLGDSYSEDKNLVGIPWRVAFALQQDDWYLRQDIIWHKPNPMPESATDRCTKSHEYIFLLTKSYKYYYDHEAIKEPSVDPESHTGRIKRGAPSEEKVLSDSGHKANNWKDIKKGKTYPTRNKRSVWTVTTRPLKDAHFATFPKKLIEPCVLAGSKQGDTVLDPFAGSGTTGLVAIENGRNFLGCELNSDYKEIAEKRINNAQPYLI